MNSPPVICLVLGAHLPLVRHPERSQAGVEQWFFEAISETYLPLLEMFDRLDADHIPFRLALSLSPTLCHQLEDPELRERYVAWTGRRLEWRRREMERAAGDPALEALTRFYYDRAVERRFLFAGRYEGNLLRVFDFYRKRGRLELLTTSATHAFLPFLAASPEGLQAQIEVAISSFRRYMGRSPQGFWLPELGWTGELDRYLRAYNFAYTIVNSHGLLAARPPADRGTYFPVRTPGGTFILGRDFYAGEDLARMIREGIYRDKQTGPGDGARKGKVRPGQQYWCSASRREERLLYDPWKARALAARHAGEFLEARISRFRSVAEHFDGQALSLCAWRADRFGRFWYEGPEFLEALFREGAKRTDVQFMTPAEYLYKQDVSSFQTMMPEYSARGFNGYAELWLDAANDWIYRHLTRSLERMIELAERFPDDTGLKERALNQAAREILLAQASDWPRMLYKRESVNYARSQIEMCLRNFTTIYEALGSNYISTEWLTSLERRHNIFPNLNYRVFRRKK